MIRDRLPWPELYRPRSSNELVGNNDAIQGLKKWIQSWTKKPPRKRAALLIGPPGVGKTASVGAITHDLGAELVEFNASDKRNKGIIETQVWKAATQQTLDGRMRIILLDEVDGLSGTSDRGGVSAILKVISIAVHPIVMTANDPESRRLKDLIKNCQVFNFYPIEHDEMLEILLHIISDQGGSANTELLDNIIENSAGDLRAAIADIETLIKGGLYDEQLVALRDMKRNVAETLKRLFMTTDAVAAKRVVSESDIDHDQLLLWIEENIHLHLSDPEELESGLEALSLADLSLGRIMKNQNWKLLAYVYDFLAAGVASSRFKTPFRRVEYSMPEWPLLVWRGNMSRDKKSKVLSRLAVIAGVSERRAMRTYFDTIIELVNKNPEIENDLAEWLGIKAGFLGRRKNPPSRQRMS
jgi:replication factor C large subunit